MCYKAKKHAKYAVRTKWSPDGTFFASASYDRTVRLYSCSYEDNEESGDSASFQCELVREFSFPRGGAIEAIIFHQGDGKLSLVVSAREDCCLHVINCGDLSDVRLLNMNELGDEHVSFSAMDISISPNGKYILVCTDKDKLLLLNFEDGKILRKFYGAENDMYAQPRHCWDASGKYLYATSQVGE